VQFKLAIASSSLILYLIIFCLFVCDSNSFNLKLRIIYCIVLILINKVVNIILCALLICQYKMYVTNNI
jgi:hypothetical protein